ncbi:alpha-galactosidase [Lachnospiraceae bacterium C7]|nr:alpha-galactosidase [Lachnospiraceae bacterium C7]
MIIRKGNYFQLDTKTTSYCFRVLETGHLEHLYYGEKITVDSEDEAEFLSEKHEFAPGNSILYSNERTNFSLEDERLEMSSYGKGDIREPFVIIAGEDGNITSDFLYKDAVIEKGKTPFETLPGSYDKNQEVDHLTITLLDKNMGVELELHYFVYEDTDVISRSSKIYNLNERKSIYVEKIMSIQLDLDEDDYVFTTFNGAWAREMQRHDFKLTAGKHINSSYTGTSSSRANPFVMLSKEKTTEDYGEAIGFNLIYSGNHYEAVEVAANHKTRIVTGINPENFEFKILPGMAFEAPEAIMTYSNCGFNGMSHNMHKFVREHITRGKYQYKERPILINSWEASYFDFNESKLLKLAKAAKNVGVELFVLDDGWFGQRNDDTTSLGDWFVNKEKLPGGLDGLAKKINDLGLDFGIWVEPEMVNVKSNLFKEHPEWALYNPKTEHSEGRNQRILDLTNDDVVEFVIDAMSSVFSSANIKYVKWDMNRIFSDYYSQNISGKGLFLQKEVAHRYVIGLYKIMGALTEKFPDILFEGCSAGGNRFDLGILSYFPQIWASDDTDAVYRVGAQNNYSYGYPASTYTAHVSACPNHQTFRTTPLDTRFNVAAFASFGYECNFNDLSKEEIEEVKEEIAIYKKYRKVFQFGDFYRNDLKDDKNIYQWQVVSQDKTVSIGMLLQKLVEANTTFNQLKLRGLDPTKKYWFTNRVIKHNIKNFGDLINTQTPIHVKTNSILQHVISKFVTMPGEVEIYHASGNALMRGQVKLSPAYGATGYNDKVRYFQDFNSRMYFIEENPENIDKNFFIKDETKKLEAKE